MNLLTTKTFWSGVLGMLGAAGAYYTGQLDATQASAIAFTGLQSILLRHAVAKATDAS